MSRNYLSILLGFFTTACIYTVEGHNYEIWASDLAQFQNETNNKNNKNRAKPIQDATFLIEFVCQKDIMDLTNYDIITNPKLCTALAHVGHYEISYLIATFNGLLHAYNKRPDAHTFERDLLQYASGKKISSINASTINSNLRLQIMLNGIRLRDYYYELYSQCLEQHNSAATRFFNKYLQISHDIVHCDQENHAPALVHDFTRSTLRRIIITDLTVQKEN